MKKLYAYTVKMFVGTVTYDPISDSSRSAATYVTKVEYFTDVDVAVLSKDDITYVRAEEHDLGA